MCSDGDLSQLWDMGSVTPLFNQTITEEVTRGTQTHAHTLIFITPTLSVIGKVLVKYNFFFLPVGNMTFPLLPFGKFFGEFRECLLSAMILYAVLTFSLWNYIWTYNENVNAYWPVSTLSYLTVVWHDLPNNSDLVLWPKASTDSYRTPSTASQRSRGILTIQQFI